MDEIYTYSDFGKNVQAFKGESKWWRTYWVRVESSQDLLHWRSSRRSRKICKIESTWEFWRSNHLHVNVKWHRVDKEEKFRKMYFKFRTSQKVREEIENSRETVHLNEDATIAKLFFRTIHSVNQLSICGTISSWCEEFGQSELLKNVKVNCLVQIPRSDNPASGNRLRECLQRIENWRKASNLQNASFWNLQHAESTHPRAGSDSRIYGANPGQTTTSSSSSYQRSKKEGHDSIVTGGKKTKSIESLSKLTNGIDISCTPTPESPVRKHHHTGVPWWGSSSWTIESTKRCQTHNENSHKRQEQGRQNSFIPKNERIRRRHFDEALRAELERMSQNWKSYWSQPCSSSSSSQCWWHHEHKDSHWREHQDTQWRQTIFKILCGSHFARFRRIRGFFTNISRTDRALDGTFTRTCVWLKNQDMIGKCCTLAHLENHPLSQHVSHASPGAFYLGQFRLRPSSFST